MAKQDSRFEMNGEVVDNLPGAKFKVLLENGHTCVCTISGKLRQNNIRIIKGDSVIIDLSIDDPNLEHGRIIWRNK